VVNFLDDMRRQPGLSQQDSLLAVTTISFDIAALELFLPLSVGARLLLADRDTASDPVQLAATLAASGATVMQATPATWRMLLDSGWQGDAQLRILCGGEALSRLLADQLLQRCAALWNLYGPTETTIWSTVKEVQPGEGLMPIGRPIANTQIYLLDPHFQPVPIGVFGELYIGGDGLAWGYLGRPALTAEKFIPNPFSPEPGARLYRTGDLARYLPDGDIEFFGRMDHQVKIRGFRIELGEIEATLSQHPAVRETVALVREELPGDKRLVAYAIPEGEPPTTTELRYFLQQKLPEYMVPAAFVMLDALPLTPNGKVDRRALPPPDWARPELALAFVAPRTPVEDALASIWSQVLGIEQVGIYDDFFELGGHSLLATRVISHMRSTLKVEVPLRTMFEAPTVAGLAESIHRQRRIIRGPGFAADDTGGRREEGEL
jgi:acyl-CoA synthetase (AMP-forming)/AMP-acid ligase II